MEARGGVFRTAGEGYARHLALMLDSVVDYAIFLLDVEGNVLTWNRGAARIKGFDASDIIGRHFSTFYTPEDLARDHPRHELDIVRREGRYEEEGWRVRKDGSRFWANVVITAIRDETGELIGFGKVTRDLTARRLAEEQLRDNAHRLEIANQELEQFRRLVLSVRDYAIFMLDPGGHITTWNPGAEHIKGYTAEEVIGRHFELFYTAEDRDRGHPAYELERAAAEGRYEEEGWRVRKDGTTFWASIVITAIRDDSGLLAGYAKVTRDLSDRRQAELELKDLNERLARTNLELDRFAGVAAHDLREPLRTVSGFSDLLLSRYEEQLDERGRMYLGHVGDAVRRMQRLVDDLLQYAKSGERPGNQERLPLTSSVERVVSELGASIDERGAELRVEVPDDAVVRAHPEDVAAVLRNLMSNAIKFADGAVPQVVVRAQPEPDAWCVEVIDNGIGIDPEQRPRIFRAFQRLHSAAEYPGTGLGLAIAQRVVERNGGSIGVDSTVGEGSRFWFSLPAA